jgi:hypothetical protein
LREDNVRKIWSEAELDAALADLNADVGAEDDGLAFARASLLAAAGVEEAPPAEPRRPGTWRWLAVAAAVVTLVGGLAVATSVLAPDPEPARPAATLTDLDRPLAPGEFRYAQKLAWVPATLGNQAILLQRKTELWIPADPAGTWHRRTAFTGGVTGLRPDQERERRNKPIQEPVDEYGPAGVFPDYPNRAGEMSPTWNTSFQNWLTPDAAFVASLVPDHRKLGKRLNFDTISLKDSGRAHSATEALTMVRSALETGLVRKDVRFALRDALPEVAGIQVVPDQHAPDGRSATIIVAKETGQRLFLDPATAQLLAADQPLNPAATVSRTTEQVPPPSATSGPPSSAVSRVTSSSEVMATITTMAPSVPPLKFGEPESVYAFAITRTSG